jgi:hypothetical protein
MTLVDGRVGIGTTSPTGGLECVNTLGEIVARSSQASSTITSLRFMGGAYTGNKATAIVLDGVSGENRLYLGGGTSYGEPATSIRFYTGTAGTLTLGTEKMRIDSSGNLLVGKTATGIATAGIELRADNSAYFTRDSGIPILVNRETSDGDIVQFRKDNTTVGSIGTEVTDATLQADLYVHARSTAGGSSLNESRLWLLGGDNGIVLDGYTNAILPTDENSYEDNRTNLGSDAYRFKDLYLSGTANVGVGRFTAQNVSHSAATLVLGHEGSSKSQIRAYGINSGTVGSLEFMVSASDGTGDKRVTIDSSGNLLVGKTAASGSTQGAELRADGRLLAVSTSDYAGYFNRKTTDGEIVRFVKDTTTIGSIGNNTDFYIASQDGTGVRFSATQVLPCSETGAIQNGSRDLGSSSGRFKDLYLSGNSYANTYRHDGDSDTYFNFPAENQLSLVAGGATILKAYQIAGAYGVLEAHGSGSATYPNFTFNGDSNTGMYRATTDALGFTTGGSEAMRIDSSGNLLVGVTSTTLTGGSLTLPNSGIIAFHDAAGNARNSLQFVSGELKHGAAGAGLTSQTFFTSATERMRIDSSGNVGIGISPVEQLHLGGRTHPVFELQANSTSGTGRINFSDTTVRGQILYEHTDDSMRLLTAATERLRIDSSGNLMVGTTDSAPAVSSSEVGVALSGPFGYVAASRSAGASGFFNRLSDGDIVNFNKDGTLVGSIGSTAGSMYIEGNPATSKVGLTFFGSTIEPRDAGAVSDGGVDLGASGSRFKDLYLSGGAYIKGQLAVTGPQVITANTTAVSGSFLTVKTAGITITLPASPSVGDFVLVKDGTGAASTSSFTVARNGQNIASSATDLTFDVNFGQITLTYVDATIGWSV